MSISEWKQNFEFPDFLDHLQHTFRLTNQSSLVLACSGGLDSIVLLHLLCRAKKHLSFSLRVLHANHGISPQAAHWQEFCKNTCKQLAVPFKGRQFELGDSAAGNLEERARKARYSWFSNDLSVDEILVTAHHADDQVETVLLQALRGAGLDGLCGMAEIRCLSSYTVIRPLLDTPRSVIAEYARAQNLQWIEDPGNTDQRFDRNYLRHAVLPTLYHRWPTLDRTIGRSSRHLAQAKGLLERHAASLLSDCRADSPEDPRNLAPPLSIDLLYSLDNPELALLLRYWLKQSGHRALTQMRLDSLINELVRTDIPHQQKRWNGLLFARYRQRLYLQSCPQAVSAYQYVWRPGQLLRIESLRIILRSENMVGQGLVIPDGACCHIHNNRRDKSGRMSNGQHKDLRKLYQELGLPPWCRGLQPILSVDDEVAAIPGYFVFPRFRCHRDGQGYRLRLCRDDTD